MPVLQFSEHARSGSAQVLSEFVATAVPFAVAAYITSAYWFTASTSFANPAVTMARALTNTFAGIRPSDVGPFIAAQCAGAAGGTLIFSWLMPVISTRTPESEMAPEVRQRA